ncbi:MAG TPA: RHS repeat-associated core domain-containing protein [Mariniphaga sp.]|nr:RHS repeat-associated core domain-containing protein [Mariniphaga sp.]
MIRTGDDFGDTTPAIKYNLEDHLGSSSILLENDGTLINKEEYYPFGETSFGSYAKKRYRYSGKEKDQESGLYYYGARYYMAMGCRFVSVDPLSNKFSNVSPFTSFNNNPIYYNDPTGMAPEGVDPKKYKAIYNNMLYAKAWYSPDCKNFHFDELPKDVQNDKEFINKLYVATGLAHSRYESLTKQHNFKIKIRKEEIRDAKTGSNTTIKHRFTPITTDFIGDYSLGIVLNVVYTTDKGNTVHFHIPVAQLDSNSTYSNSYSDMINTIHNDDLDLFTNCFADALGLIGYLDYNGFKQILKDEYGLSNEKIGAIGFFDVGGDGHAFQIIGKNDKGEFLYRSNYRDDYTVEGTFKEIQEQVYNLSGQLMTKENIKFYAKK